MEGMRENVIGIDLGTNYARVGVWNHNGVIICPNDRGKRSTPAYVAFTDIEILVGDAAKDQFSLNDKNTVYDIKRLIGRKFSDASVQSDAKLWPFQIVGDSNDKPRVVVTFKGKRRLLSPEAILSIILRRVKEIAEYYLGTPVKKAVITVPTYFSNSQRQATKDTAAIAGLQVLNIMNEPTAAAIAYGLYKGNEHGYLRDGDGGKGKSILVFDLGGGTCNVSLLTIEKGIFHVKGTTGNSHLDGEDFTNRLVKHFVEEFKMKHEKHHMSLKLKPLRLLRTECEKIKKALSYSDQSDIMIESFYDDIDLTSMITRETFEKINKDYFEKCLNLVRRCLKDADIRKNVEEVILVGGSTQIPRIRELLKMFFNRKKFCTNIDPEEAVASGAAVQAAVLMGYRKRELQDPVFLDVSPLPFGLETPDGAMDILIPRNTPIPHQTKRVLISSSNHNGVSMGVYQGNSERAKYNKKLYTIMIPENSEIEVKFDADLDGILRVNFETNNTGQSDRFKISCDQEGMSNEEIEKISQQASSYSHTVEHEFRQINSKEPFTCHGCWQKGCGPRYICESCFEHQLHEDCMRPPAYHEFTGCSFKFFNKPPEKYYKECRDNCRRKCIACGNNVEAYVYFCEEKYQFLHPCCLNLKENILIGGVLFSLNGEMQNECILCKERRYPNYGSRIPGWTYMCENEKYNIHVNCVLKMAIKSMASGAVTNIKYESLALQELNKFFRTVLLISRTIAGVVVGDPTAIHDSVLEDILEDHPFNINPLGSVTKDLSVAFGNYQVVASPEYECQVIDIPEDIGGNVKQHRGRCQFLRIRPSYNNITLQKIITVANFVMQCFSATTEQLDLCSKLPYAIVLMILSLLSMASCIWELAHRMKRQGIKWRWKGKRSWFYKKDYGLTFANLIDIFGFLTAVDEGVLSMVTLIYAIRGAKNPVHVNMWPLINSGILMLYSIFRVRETITLPVKRND